MGRTALEALALEGYRAERLPEEQFRWMLGFESRFDVYAFLKPNQTFLDYTEADRAHDLAVAHGCSAFAARPAGPPVVARKSGTQ